MTRLCPGYFFFLALLFVGLLAPVTECVGERRAMPEPMSLGMTMKSSSLTKESDDRERSFTSKNEVKDQIRRGQNNLSILFLIQRPQILLKIIVHRLNFIFMAKVYVSRAMSFSVAVTLAIGIQFPQQTLLSALYSGKSCADYSRMLFSHCAS